jgi:hypothetical protein
VPVLLTISTTFAPARDLGSSAAERAEATQWWLELTEAGGEGMVV